MNGKRKKVVVSIEKKLEALSRLDQGESLKSIAKDLGVGIVTVGDWKRKRKELEAWYAQKASGSGLGERKTMKKSVFENVGEALFQWYIIQHKKGVPISGPILQEKALTLHEKFNPGDEFKFTASNGWLDRWKNRYGIRHVHMQSDAHTSSEVSIETFYKNLNDYIEEQQLKMDQIYYCTETRLNFKMLPKKLIHSKDGNIIEELANTQERVTLFICSNVTGTQKLPLICIGQFFKPEDLKPNQTILKYKYQNNGWIDKELIKTWFIEEFIPNVEKFLVESGLSKKAVFLMDNISNHPTPSELQSDLVKVFSYPTIENNSIQAMTHLVIESLKLKYRYSFLQSLLNCKENGDTVQEHFLLGNIIDGQKAIQHFNRLTRVQIIYLIADAWQQMRNATFSKCWRSIFGEFIKEETDDKNDNIINLIQGLPGCEILRRNDILEWVNIDHNDDIILEDIVASQAVLNNSNEIYLKEDIFNSNDFGHTRSNQNIANEIDIKEVMENNTQEESFSSMLFNISHHDASIALETALQYVKQQNTASFKDIAVLKKWRDFALTQLNLNKQYVM